MFLLVFKTTHLPVVLCVFVKQRTSPVYVRLIQCMPRQSSSTQAVSAVTKNLRNSEIEVRFCASIPETTQTAAACMVSNGELSDFSHFTHDQNLNKPPIKWTLTKKPKRELDRKENVTCVNNLKKTCHWSEHVENKHSWIMYYIHWIYAKIYSQQVSLRKNILLATW